MGFSAQKHAYYEKHVEAWRHSGLSQKKYCEQANIAYGSFNLKKSVEICHNLRTY